MLILLTENLWLLNFHIKFPPLFRLTIILIKFINQFTSNYILQKFPSWDFIDIKTPFTDRLQNIQHYKSQKTFSIE